MPYPIAGRWPTPPSVWRRDGARRRSGGGGSGGAGCSTFGTDATAVAAAIHAADSPDGVLVLMDLGSAVMSAELTLELLDPEIAAHVRLCSAPLVEGLVAAVVTARTGATIDAVTTEAMSGLAAKQEHLQDVSDAGAEPVRGSGELPTGELSAEVAVVNEHGIHARPGARLVDMVSKYDAQVNIENLSRGLGPVTADSMIMLATLDSHPGDQLKVRASGPAAAQALQAVVQFIADGLGD